MSMSRLSAGLITGGIGAVLLVILSLTQIPIISYAIPLLVGIGAGYLVANNTAFASKTGGAGALAGLIAGAILFAVTLIFTVIFVNTPAGQSVVNQVYATVQAAQPTPTSGSSTTPVISKSTIQTFTYVGGCIGGLLYLGLATAVGAATGAIAGRNNRADELPPDANYPTFGAPPQSPYGSQQPPSQQ